MSKTKKRSNEEARNAYNLELEVLQVFTNQTGYAWSLREIAGVCGVSMQAIHTCERRALMKLRHRAKLKTLV